MFALCFAKLSFGRDWDTIAKITRTLERLVAEHRASVRYLVAPESVGNCPEALRRLVREGAAQCRLRAPNDEPIRLFGIRDPAAPESSLVAWTVVPKGNLSVAFSGQEATEMQRAVFDKVWDEAKERPCPFSR